MSKRYRITGVEATIGGMNAETWDKIASQHFMAALRVGDEASYEGISKNAREQADEDIAEIRKKENEARANARQCRENYYIDQFIDHLVEAIVTKLKTPTETDK